MLNYIFLIKLIFTFKYDLNIIIHSFRGVIVNVSNLIYVTYSLNGFLNKFNLK